MTDRPTLPEIANDKVGEELPLLIQRHLDWVHSLCRRSMRDVAWADDVTQTVFMILMKKWPHLPQGVNMTGWLFNTTRYCCHCALRDENTRRRHELAAAHIRSEPAATEVSIGDEDLLPLLDEQVARLSQADRTAVLLRYYERRSFRKIGDEMGISEEAAKKRVRRAVEKLRTRMTDKQVPLAADALAAIMAEKLVQPAPAKLTAAILAHAGDMATYTAVGAHGSRLKVLRSGKMAAAAVGVVLAAGLVTTGVVAVLANHKQAMPAPQMVAAPPSPRPAAPVPADAEKPPNLTEAQWVALFQAYARKIRALSVQASDHSWDQSREMSKETQPHRPPHWVTITQTSTGMESVDWDLRRGRIFSTSFISDDSMVLGGIRKEIPFPLEPRIMVSRKKLCCQANCGRYMDATILGPDNAAYALLASTAPGFLDVLPEDWNLFSRPLNPRIPLKVMLREYRTVRQYNDADGTIELRFIGKYVKRPYWPPSEFRYRLRINGGLRVYRESVVDYDNHHHHPFREFLTQFSRFQKRDGIWLPMRIRARVWGYPTNQLLSDQEITISHIEVHRPFEKGTFQIPPSAPGGITDERYGIFYDVASAHDSAQLLPPAKTAFARIKGFVMPPEVAKAFIPDARVPISAEFRIQSRSDQKVDFQLRPKDPGVTVSPPSFTIFPGGSQNVSVKMNAPPGDRPYCFYLSLNGHSGPPNGRKLSTRIPVFFLPSPALGAQPGSLILSPGNFAGQAGYSATLHFLHPMGGSVTVDMVNPGSPEVTVPRWSEKSMDVVITPVASATAIFSHITILYTYNGHLEKMRIPVIGLVHK